MAKKLTALCLALLMLLPLAACAAQDGTTEDAEISIAESSDGAAFSFEADVSAQGTTVTDALSTDAAPAD